VLPSGLLYDAEITACIVYFRYEAGWVPDPVWI